MSILHIGITIGPIYKTFQKADKTRELWGGSYLFSYLCRQLVLELQSKDGITILLPSPKSALDMKNLLVKKPGVGLYPDRILLQVKGDKLDDVKNVVRDVKDKVVSEMLRYIQSYRAYDPYARLLKMHIRNNYENAKDYLFNYLQVYTIQADLSQDNLKENERPLGTVKSLNTLLDHAELRSSITSFDPDPIKVFLRGINHSFLLNDALDESFNHFPSLPEITTTEIRFISENIRNEYDRIIESDYNELVKNEQLKTMELLNNPDAEDKSIEDENDLESDLKEDDLLNRLIRLAEKNDRRLYHKYIAIVHADGDRMGNLIGSLPDDQVQGFSEDLLEFAQKANEVIAGKRFTQGAKTDWGFGGAPIYIGGDDLVFFAPIACRKIVNGHSVPQFQTVLHLIKDIDKIFDDVFNKKKSDGSYEKYQLYTINRPCMTYGVSIAYFKRPLHEIYSESYELMQAVKNNNYKTRNRINLKITKHSGQWFGGVLDKNDQSTWEKVIELISEKNILKAESGHIEQFVNSVTQKLRYYKAVIIKCAKDDNDDELQKHIIALFDNAFNEGIHNTVRDYLNQVRDLLISMLIMTRKNELLSGGMTKAEHIKQTIDTLYGIIRLLHFIRDTRAPVSKPSPQILEV
ncbi:MAG: hypothetical protein IPM92_02700 [Saprospiraceae bacterium]|nr:hypothetical protein [Saprospiraceae bacterium]